MSLRIFLLLMLWLGAVTGELSAQVVRLSDAVSSVDVSRQAQYVVTSTTAKHPQALDQGGALRWQRAKGDVVNLLYKDDAVWVRLALDARNVQSENWLLDIGWPFLDRIEAWWVPAQHDLVDARYLGEAGDHIAVSQHLMTHRHPLIDLSSVAGQQGELWLRIVSTSSIMLSFSIWDTTDYLRYEVRVQFVLGILIGIMLIMAVYNLGIWVFIREPAYGFYVLYTFEITLYVATLSGLGNQYLWGGITWLSDKMLVLTVVLSFLFGTYFVMYFLDLKVRNRPAYRLVRFMILLYWLILIPALLLPEAWVAWPGQIMGVLITLGALVIGIAEWRRGSVAARHFTIAWFLLLTGTCVYTLMLAGILAQNLFTETVQIVGVVAEIVLLSFALGDRVNRERQTARQATEMSLHLARELNIAHEEKIRTQAESNVRLEQQVDARTRDLQKALVELESANQQLAALSVTDQLTGLYNRRYFDMHVEDELRRCVRSHLPIAVVVLDIDHFKRINDSYGHLFGDECLQKVAQVMSQHTQRPGDVAVRFGGEEFVMLLPGTDLQGAIQVAESIRQAVARIALHYQSTKITLTISIGVLVKIPQTGDTVDLLLEAADAALYQAKENGRNRVEVA